MPLIRYTYPKDVAEFGSEPVEVSWVTAHTLVIQRRRALLVDEPTVPAVSASELTDQPTADEAFIPLEAGDRAREILCASCPGSGCAGCPLEQ